MKKRVLSLLLVLLMVISLVPISALAATTYYINGVAVRYDDFSSSPNECWVYANNIYNKIWGHNFTNSFSDSENSLRNLSDSELTLTAAHLKSYVSNAAIGSCLRICNGEYLHGSDGWGHSQIIVQKDDNGFTVFEGGLSNYPYCREKYYTWNEYVNTGWLGGTYSYIKYVKWPGAPTYSGGTVSPDPGLSVVDTIICKRKIELPERVVNLYSNPTDTTRLTYFDYGPTVYSSRHAIMSDGNIMYEISANHQGQVMKLWLQYESDMIVTKEHTYGSTQYESAHPHRGYRVCECGDKDYTGETTTKDDCGECGGEVKYAVEGGYLTFNKKTGTITDCDSSVTKANIPHTINSVTVKSIGASAFSNCYSLTSVTIPTGVTSIGKYAFRNCASLASIDIPNSVTSIGNNAFYCCQSLASITIPNSVTSIDTYAFYGCSSLTSVIIPNSVTSIGECAFGSCSSLASVTIPNSVTSIGIFAFQLCTSLTNVTIPNSVTSISDCAFESCTRLASVIIPNSVTSIGWAAFRCCESLASITLPNSVTSIGNNAFYYCTSLVSITIPNSVTSIGNNAFYHCTSLASVTISNSVTSIGTDAFDACRSLADVYYCGSAAQWGRISIGEHNDSLLKASFHYNYDPNMSFTDVAPGSYCYDAVQWAVANGITKGTDATHFSPNAGCTRGQVVTFLWRAAGEPTVSGNVGFVDVAPGSYCYEAVKWAVANGITNGTDAAHFSPNATCTRGQVVTFMYRAAGESAVGGSNGFDDVATGSYCYNAVQWAVANGITKGTDTTHFSPNATCTRGQVVTFLYRAQ